VSSCAAALAGYNRCRTERDRCGDWTVAPQRGAPSILRALSGVSLSFLTVRAALALPACRRRATAVLHKRAVSALMAAAIQIHHNASQHVS